MVVVVVMVVVLVVVVVQGKDSTLAQACHSEAGWALRFGELVGPTISYSPPSHYSLGVAPTLRDPLEEATVEVLPSLLPGAQQGLFLRRPVAQGEVGSSSSSRPPLLFLSFSSPLLFLLLSFSSPLLFLLLSFSSPLLFLLLSSSLPSPPFLLIPSSFSPPATRWSPSTPATSSTARRACGPWTGAS